MSGLILNGVDIEPYIPNHLKSDKKEQAFHLAQSIQVAVDSRLPIGFSYNDKTRLILPHSLYTQDKTPRIQSSVNRKTLGFRTKMKFYNNGARRAIGIDGHQELSVGDDSQEGWKSYHLDNIDDLRLLTREELNSAFEIFSDDEELYGTFEPKDDFVRNWNYWFRKYITQVPSELDLLK